MFQKRPTTPAAKAERLIKRHLSESARAEFIKDLLCIPLVLITLAVLGVAAILLRPEENVALIYAYYGILIFLSIFIAVIFIVFTTRIIPLHFRAIHTAESSWVKYQHFAIATSSQLQGQLHTAQTNLDAHNYNIATLRNEQNRLRNECSKAVEGLESQIATEEKLISAEDLNNQITLLQQIIALHTPPHV